MARMTGFVFQDEYLTKLRKLTDEELGRLVRAVALYHMSGEEPELDGAAALACDFIRADVDRIEEQYRLKCETNRRNRLGNEEKAPAASNAVKKGRPSTIVPEDKVKEKDKDICPEQAPADCEALPLNDGEEWRPTKADLDEWIRLYPAVDVKQEIRNMRGWCASNPSRRKTRAGIKRFVTAWLSREQSKPRAAPKPANAFVNFEQRNYDYAALERALLKGGSG